MVKTYKMKETEMGYRGSKSELLFNNQQPKIISVKVQRVDGSWFIKTQNNKFKVYSNGFREILSSQIPF
jgi:hypothetical protein